MWTKGLCCAPDHNHTTTTTWTTQNTHSDNKTQCPNSRMTSSHRVFGPWTRRATWIRPLFRDFLSTGWWGWRPQRSMGVSEWVSDSIYYERMCALYVRAVFTRGVRQPIGKQISASTYHFFWAHNYENYNSCFKVTWCPSYVYHSSTILLRTSYILQLVGNTIASRPRQNPFLFCPTRNRKIYNKTRTEYKFNRCLLWCTVK